MAVATAALFRRPGETIVGGALLALLGLLVVYPMVMLVYGSLQIQPPGQPSQFGLENLGKIFGQWRFYAAWGNTLLVSVIAAFIALVSGLIAAFLIARTDLPGARVFEAFVILPIFISPFIGALAWHGIGAPRVGLLNRLLDDIGAPFNIDIYSITGIAVVLGFYMTPYVYLFTSGTLRSIDAGMEEASRLSGRGPLQTLLRVTLPLITPSILAVGLLVVVLCIENFGVLAVLGLPAQIPFIPTEIYLKFAYPPADYGYATSVSFTLIAATAVGLYAQKRVISRSSYVAIAGRGYRAQPFGLKRWKWVAAVAFAAYVAVSVVLPFAVLVLASFQSYWSTDLSAFTLDNYRDMFSRGLLVRATKNSLFLSILGAFVATALAVTVAYVVERTQAPGRRLIDFLSTMSVAIPGIVLGMALLWAWIYVPLPVYGTIWVLLFAYLTRFLSFGVRNVSAALTQVGPDLEAAARMSGASRLRAATTITLPLVRNSIISSWVIYFISIIKELNASILLYSFSSIVIPVVIFDAHAEGHYTQVAALATGVTVLVLLVLALFSWVFKINLTPRA